MTLPPVMRSARTLSRSVRSSSSSRMKNPSTKRNVARNAAATTSLRLFGSALIGSTGGLMILSVAEVICRFFWRRRAVLRAVRIERYDCSEKLISRPLRLSVEPTGEKWVYLSSSSVLRSFMTASSARDFSASSTAASHSATIELVESPSLVYCRLAMLVVISCRLRVSSASFLRRSPVLLRLAAMLGRSESVSPLSVGAGWKASAAEMRE